MALDNTNILNKPMFNTSEDLTALLAIFWFQQWADSGAKSKWKDFISLV